MQPEGPGERVQDRVGHVLRAALLEPGEVVDADPGQLRELLAAQPRYPALVHTGRKAQVGGVEGGSVGLQEGAELGGVGHVDKYPPAAAGPAWYCRT